MDSWCLRSPTLELTVINYGSIITGLRTPDRHGVWADVVLGYSDLSEYLTGGSYLGAVVGRYANRIANARFTIDGRPFQLHANDGVHHLHGGRVGFDRHLWHPHHADVSPGRIAISLARTSPDGEEGYPGELSATVCYSMHDDGTVAIVYGASTTAPTFVNLTQHSYFNLAGERGDPSTDNHELTINAAGYTPVQPDLIPTGQVAVVENTPFDFRTPRRIGTALGTEHEQLRRAKGFDHNWVLDAGDGMTPAARLHHPASGRTMDVSTTEPGLQFYGGQLLDGTSGAYGRAFVARAGLCLETQHFPDSPHQPQFPTTVLWPGERYRSETRWAFSVN